MLDTNICSYIIRNRPESVKKKLKVVKHFIDCFVVYDFDLKAAKEYALIRANLEKKGTVIGAYDLQIAAHARSLSAVLVTNNEKEFLRVEGLKVENWLKNTD